ncbi:MAG: hypothetical protein QM756_41250 [Polyangiaceae bacterium]
MTASGPLVSELSNTFSASSAVKSDAHLVSCLSAARSAIGNASALLGTVMTNASQTAAAVGGGSTGGGMCALDDADTACTSCVKGTCCPQFDACNNDQACSGATSEFDCVVSCYQNGGNAATCESGTACRASTSASFSSNTLNLLSCAHSTCQSACFGKATVCPSNQLSCGDVCVNPLSDAKNCGGCGRACSTGQSCLEGACTCPSETTLCSSGCVDINYDTSNCGKCNAVCGSSQTCEQGKCVSSGGAGGQSGVAGNSAVAGQASGLGGTTSSGGGAANGGAGATGGVSGGGGAAAGGGTAGSAGTAGAGGATCPTSQPQSGSACPTGLTGCQYTGGYICSCGADGWSCFLG